MSKADELKSKNENLFKKNTILLNENERLKNELEETKLAFDTWKKNNDFIHKATKIERLQNEIAGLEKENAGLKELIENSNKDGISPINALIIKNLAQQVEEYQSGNFVQTVNQIIEGKDKRLEQAKEIIKGFLDFENGKTIHIKDMVEQAEQFLKEIEK